MKFWDEAEIERSRSQLYQARRSVLSNDGLDVELGPALQAGRSLPGMALSGVMAPVWSDALKARWSYSQLFQPKQVSIRLRAVRNGTEGFPSVCSPCVVPSSRTGALVRFLARGASENEPSASETPEELNLRLPSSRGGLGDRNHERDHGTCEPRQHDKDRR